MKLAAGMIVVTEGGNDWIARAIKWATRSRWTHTFMVLSDSVGVEAWFPDGVRLLDLPTRFQNLKDEGRDFVVLDCPELTEDDRRKLVSTAHLFVGRKYDVLQALYFAVFRRFIDDGPLRVICSRLETAIYKKGAGLDLFTEASMIAHHTVESRRWQLALGWATPSEMLNDSVLEPVQTAASDDLQTDFDEQYEDVELYKNVTAEHEALSKA